MALMFLPILEVLSATRLRFGSLLIALAGASIYNLSWSMSALADCGPGSPPDCTCVVSETPVLTSSLSSLEQITVRFDATITNASGGEPFNLPFEYDVGDVIHGKMTFEPTRAISLVEGPAATTQMYEFEFDINGVRVGSTAYGLRVLDNSAILDFPLPGEPVFDVLTAGCSIDPNFPSCMHDPISIPGGDPFGLSVRLELIGDNETISAGEHLSTISQLNHFELERTLNLTFDGAGPGVEGLQANVSDFAIVPEPTSVILPALSFFLSAIPRKLIARGNHAADATRNLVI